MRHGSRLAIAVIAATWLVTMGPATASASSEQVKKNVPEPDRPSRTDAEKAGARRGLSLDELMKGARPGPEEQAPAITPNNASPRKAPASPGTVALPAPGGPSNAASSGQLSLDGIEAGREAVKIAAAKDRVRTLGQRLASSCGCVTDGSCFKPPAFKHDEMNVAIRGQADTYELQVRDLCDQWSPSAAESLPDDRQALAGVEMHLQQLFDAKQQMHAALDTRVAEFRAEEQRIQSAIAKAEAEARALAEAQARAEAQANKKRSGLFAGVLALGAGAIVADSLGAQIDPEALARTSIGVGKAVANGEGVAGALDAGIQGLNQMARTAVPKIDVPSPPAGGDFTADAMAQVKRFPEPGAATGSAPGSMPDVYRPAAGDHAPPASPYADLVAAVGRPGAPPMPDGLSPEAIAEAQAALQTGTDMLAAGVTPGGPGTDAFGVRDPTTERFEFSCKKRSNIPLSDGAGGTTYYYERKISGVINYWRPECGRAFKAYYITYGCNDIDDFAKVEADCVTACGAPDCRDVIYERSVMEGGS